jgi:hypothetical protein
MVVVGYALRRADYHVPPAPRLGLDDCALRASYDFALHVRASSMSLMHVRWLVIRHLYAESLNPVSFVVIVHLEPLFHGGLRRNYSRPRLLIGDVIRWFCMGVVRFLLLLSGVGKGMFMSPLSRCRNQLLMRN